MNQVKIISYLKDYRFSSILIKYFLLLFICLVIPVISLSLWYANQMQDNLEQEVLKRNEASLEQAYDNVNSVILSMKDMAYSISRYEGIQYLNTRSSVQSDTTGNLETVKNLLSLVCTSNDYVNSICVYFSRSNECITDNGVYVMDQYQDNEWLEMYSEDMPNRTVIRARKKNGKYPYLLTILSPISSGKDDSIGAVVINIDVEELGEYIGSGRYRNKDYSPMLLIFDQQMEKLVYSDEYRLLQEETFAFDIIDHFTEKISGIYELWGESYLVSGVFSEQDGLHYIYLSSMRQFDSQSEAATRLLLGVTIVVGIVCLILASLLAVWVYKPIQNTIRVLKDMTMLTEWDKKEHVDEMEAIQRSILSAKREQDNLNEQIQERIISLHNAQICALQTQINPHFLNNTLEAIGNAAALLMKGENKVTEMIYALGSLMRISLSGENYLVPLEEELKHVELYVKLVDFRFRGRIAMHIEIPEELKREKIVKLTLQPLIENAIEHGLAKRRNNGNIWIRGERQEEKIYIHVIDNGDGVSEEELIRLQKQLEDSSINSGRHIGLRNVNQRLKLVFGDGCGLRLSSVPISGLCVTVCYKIL